MESEHWAYKIADELVKKYKDKRVVCASGISPSGSVHIGNLREAITTDFVYKVLQEKGCNVEFIFSWDDFDKFRKVPSGFPKSLEASIGKPYTAIEDPFGEYGSYAERFEIEFERSLSELDIHPRFIRQTEMYKSGQYDRQIKEIIDKRHQIAEIIARNMTQGMTEEQKDNYFPIVLYSRFTGKDNTRILSYDGGNKLTYLCHDTGKKDIIDFTNDRIVKLSWKIDWPMRWVFESVDFEPGGPDHASPGSSYDVASQITKEIFFRDAPDFQEYQFVRIKGEDAKMSSSAGNVITPNELLKVYPPELIRWLYAKAHPTSILDIAFDQDVIKNYIEFDRLMSKSPSTLESKIIFLSKLDENKKTKQINFKTLVGLGEATNFNEEAIFQLLNNIGEEYNSRLTSERLRRANYWLINHFPKGRNELLESFNSTYYVSLIEKEKLQIDELRKLIRERRQRSLGDMETALYGIPKEIGMTEEQKKKVQKKFFINIYNLWFGKDTGPRLPTYVWASTSKDKLEKLLGGK